MLSLNDAKAMMTEDSMGNLKKLVTPKPVINTTNKVNNDILMQALCTAVEDGVIHTEALNERLVKLLNSPTNTLSPSKLGEILSHLRDTQPRMVCSITLETTSEGVKQEWIFTGPTCKFNKMFEYVVDEYNITPHMVRIRMTEMLKPTIVNNIAQLIAKYQNVDKTERDNITISITTITRLVNMCGDMLYAEFKEK